MFSSQLLAALVLFVVFLLVFEQKLVVPIWLQPAGRMHPLLLHFPIVLLLLALVLEIFRFSKSTTNNTFYAALQHYLFLSAALLCGFTVVMGLILSREEGYEGATLQWHKWTGAALFFLSALLFFVRNRQWYKRPFVVSSGLVVTALLILTGHYGATLTHGDNFVWQPLSAYHQEKQVAFEEAVVFKDVIQPILEKKCASCHNPDKIKGELLLTDSAGIMKGGKTGLLFTPGSIETSLLLDRIHLPLEEEEHMPPKGKIQLTDFEVELLTAWVASSTTWFNKKVADLPEADTLRQLIAAVLNTDGPAEEHFDFAAANEKDITALNNDYRTILLLAKGSPALTVNLYNREVYNVKQLEELGKIKNNIVSLNLNKLPVKDEDLKVIRQFNNLRELYLNFTDVTAAGLKNLIGLPYLKNLSVSGTQVQFKELETILPQLSSLQSIAVWNTSLSSDEMASLQQQNKNLSVITGFIDDGSDVLKLNPPQVSNKTPVFESSIVPGLFHPVKGVEIRYTTDGTDPDSLSPVFKDGMVLNSNTTIRAKAFKEGWDASDVISFDFLRNTIKPDSAVLLNKLNHVHLAEGANTFFDTRLGALGANNPAWANFFAGVRAEDMQLVCFFNQPTTIQSYGIHYMIEEKTGIYPPNTVEIWGGENPEKLKLIATMKVPAPEKGTYHITLSETTFNPVTVSCLKIVAKPFEIDKRRYLLLIDEMFLN